MMPIEIIKIQQDQVEKLQNIGIATFNETFAAINSEENMRFYLENSFSKDKLYDELANKDSEFYFAILQNEAIGYLKVNFAQAQTELKESNALEIERIYVLKKFHAKGVGQLLYEKAVKIAKSKSIEYLWLGVWEENHKALNFYTKNGFVAFDKHIFKLGNDEQTDVMMKLQL